MHRLEQNEQGTGTEKNSKALVRLIGAMKVARGGRTVNIASDEDGKGRRNRGAASPTFGKNRQSLVEANPPSLHPCCSPPLPHGQLQAMNYIICFSSRYVAVGFL